MVSRYVPHRWVGQDEDNRCLTCGLLVDGALVRDEEFLAPSCPGKDWLCPADTEGHGPHHLEPDGSGPGGAECHYCGRPAKRLAPA